MSLTGSGGGSAMPPSRLLALLRGLQGATSQDLAPDLPPPPSKRLGLFGGGYRAYMAGLGDHGALPAFQNTGLAVSSGRQAMQLASHGACANCHAAAPPPPSVSHPELKPLPPLPAPGGWTSLLPPPLGGLAAAGWLADVLSGPQTSEYRRSGGRQPPPSGGNGDPNEWSSKPECTAQYNSDLAVCRSEDRPSDCWSRANERLATCNQGKVDFPPLRGWPPRS